MLEDIDKIMEMMRIEEESPIDDEIQLMKTFLDFESLPDSKALKLYTTLSSTSRPIALL